MRKAPEPLKRFAKLFAVDMKAPEKEALKALADRRGSEAAKAEVSEGMEWKDEPGEARVASNNLVENAHRCDLAFPKALKIMASISVAKLESGEWVSGFFVQGPKFGTSDPVSANGTKYGDRALAVRAGLLAIQQQLATAHGDSAVPGPLTAAIERVKLWIAEVGGDGQGQMADGKGAKAKGKKKGGAK